MKCHIICIVPWKDLIKYLQKCEVYILYINVMYILYINVLLAKNMFLENVWCLETFWVHLLSQFCTLFSPLSALSAYWMAYYILYAKITDWYTPVFYFQQKTPSVYPKLCLPYFSVHLTAIKVQYLGTSPSTSEFFRWPRSQWSKVQQI